MFPRLPLLTLLAALACKDDTPADDSATTDDTAIVEDDPDADGDGVPASADCDDNNSAVFPGATELCDSLDNNCDGVVDDDAQDRITVYRDSDGDGYGDPSTEELACAPGGGYTEQSGDCDDTDPAFHPGASEDDCADPNDYNCDGSVGYTDNDSDGVPACEDCDDADPSLQTATDEVCDDKDNDCDGLTDEPDAEDAATWHRDSDGDGYGDPDYSQAACDQPSGYVSDDGDCDDTDAARNPDTVWYLDYDRDSYGAAGFSLQQCDQPTGYTDNDLDCDDTDPSLNPDTVWYADSDSDGYGDASSGAAQCDQPSGHVADSTDCDDTRGSVYPGATEKCDSVDSDCDGSTEDPDSTDALTWYADADGDGYGDASSTANACSQPGGYTADSTDCDDSNATAYPDAHGTEVPGDGVDVNCDGLDVCTDLNCDSWPDIVFSNYYDGSGWTLDSTVYYGSASGYSASSRLDLPTKGARGAHVEDIDGDGYPDIIFVAYRDTNYTTDSYVYWGSSAGYSTSDRTALSTTGGIDVCVGDLDADGYKDLVFANYYNGSSYKIDSTIYWGSASGYSTADTTDLPTQGARQCEVIDLDGDGYLEVLFANYYDGSSNSVDSYIYWGSSAGYSTSDRTTLDSNRTPSLNVEDIDSDGWPDILLVNYYDGSYTTNSYLYWGSSAGYSNSDRTSLAGVGPWRADISDLNNDGYLDIVFAGYASASSTFSSVTSYAWMGTATGYSSSSRYTLTASGARFVTAFDADGDGYEEVLYSNMRRTSTDHTTNSWVYEGSKSGYSTSARTDLPTEGSYAHAVGDLDGDGWYDIVFSNYYDDSVYTLDSFIYWGSASGYSSSDRTDLATEGAWGAPVIVGAFSTPD